MDIRYIVSMNSVGLVALLFFLFFQINNSIFSKKHSRVFYISTVVLFFLIAFDILQYMAESALKTMPSYSEITIVLTSICYMINPVLPVCLLFLFGGKVWKYGVAAIMVNALLVIVSLIMGWMIGVNENNEIFKYPLAYFPQIISCLCFLFIVIKEISNLKIERWRESAFYYCCFLVILASYLLELFCEGYRFVLWNISAVCLVMFYLFQQMQSNKKDTLTGAYNRSAFEKNIQTRLNETDVSVVVFDANNLKKVNDVLGHKAGDAMLIEITENIKKAFTFGDLFRIGGDEFVFIQSRHGANFNVALEKFEKLNEKGIVSYGYAVSNKNKDLLKTFDEADTAMYADKRRRKAERSIADDKEQIPTN